MVRRSSHLPQLLPFLLCLAFAAHQPGCSFDRSGLLSPDASVNPRLDAEPGDAAPKDAAPEDAAPEDAAPEDAAPEDAAPEDAAPEDAAPEDAGPQDAAPEDAEPPDGTVTDGGPDASGTVCGNDVLETGEECDGLDLGGSSCLTLGYDGGLLGCTSTCLFDESTCTTCGDGVAAGDEMCDGADLRGASCASRGYDSGTLVCTGGCVFDESDCATCGDALVGGDEECDDGPFNSDTEPDACRTSCTLHHCGDGVCDTAEHGGLCPQDCTTVVLWEDFEGAWKGSWTTGDDNGSYGTDTWGRVSNRSVSPTRSLHCAEDGERLGGGYDNDMDAWANRAVDLAPFAGQTITLYLWVRVKTDNNNDWYETRYHNGTSWTALERVSEDSGGWVLKTYDISSQAGNGSFVLRLFFHSNWALSTEDGANVDDILITALK